MDLALLRVLSALLRTQSLSQTSRGLGLPIAVVDQHLVRLRQLTGDKLLESRGSTLQATAGAHDILLAAREAVRAMEQIASGPRPFDPTQSRRHFRLGVPDSIDPGYLPLLLARLRREAPFARLDVLTVTQDHDFVGGLESGDLDGVMGSWSTTPAHLRKAHLYDDPVVCLAGPPALERIGGPLTRTQYLAASHVALAPSVGWQISAIDQQFRQSRMRRRIALTVSRGSLVPGLLAREPLLFTTGSRFAHFWATAFDLTILPCPIPMHALRYQQLWHERSQFSPATRWLRTQCRYAARRWKALDCLIANCTQ